MAWQQKPSYNNNNSGSSSNNFNGKMDINSSIIFLMTDIIKTSQEARSSGQMITVQGWGAKIVMIDAMLFPMFCDDQEFLEKRKTLKKVKDYQRNSILAFNLYTDWFELLSSKLPSLGIFGEKTVKVGWDWDSGEFEE